jgi:uridine kinase
MSSSDASPAGRSSDEPGAADASGVGDPGVLSDVPDVHPRLIERVLLSRPRVGEVRLVCIDGPAGAGKTTLAARVAAALQPSFGEVPVVHGDEVYEGWPVVGIAPDRIAAFAMLAERIDAWLFERWRHGLDAAHPCWDWHAGAWGEPVAVPAAPVVILEGVALGSRPLRAQSVLSVWVDCDPALRLPRVLARDGDALADPMAGWQRDEHVWHQLDDTAVGCDVTLLTG